MSDATSARDKLRISCADSIELMTAYLELALETSDLARFRSHLAGCEACSVFLDQLGRTIQVVASVRGSQEYEIDDRTMGRLVTQLRKTAR